MFTRHTLLSAFAGTSALIGVSVATTGPAQAWCGYYGCGYGYSDGAIAAGIVGGLAVGAIAATAAHQAREADGRRRAANRARTRQARR